MANGWSRRKANTSKTSARSRARASCEIPRSSAEDIELALDAAHAAADGWGRTAVAERANRLNRIADRMEAHLEMLAVAETWDNGKSVRETLAADLPLAIDHFRYFAGCIRAQEGALSKSTTTPSPTTSTNRWAWSARSSPGISQPDGGLETGAGAWPPATAWS